MFGETQGDVHESVGIKGYQSASGDLIPNEKTGQHEIRHSSVPIDAHSCSSSE